ncbi:unnamed protein product [Oppiella nova]|uniref:Uncharacterized protein n=1 Tax=Oppiella nova TaxID=334625 RepID=A0A7R9M223_9ACAR|nr:unnamed protein product [Oppiella nova]CAG2169099.1 unnamed protein product [Oppiella nova]
MFDLYDEDEDENKSGPLVPVSSPLSTQVSTPASTFVAEASDEQLVAMPPDMLIASANERHMLIAQETKILSDKMKQCELIVLKAYRVSDFVPTCDTSDQEKMWKGTITPILLQTITEDVYARSVITESFSALRVLSITLQSAYEIIRATRGSPEAIEIAKQDIPEALANIDKCIEKVENLKNEGMRKFGDSTKIILEIAGPAIADKVDDLALYNKEINKALETEIRLLNNLHKAEADAIHYENLIKVVKSKREAVQKEINAIENQKEQLLDMKIELNQKIQNIPAKITEERKVKTTDKMLWGLFKKKSSQVIIEEVDNPNRESEQKFYESVINARSDRIAKEDGTANARRAVVDDLDKQIKKYDKAYQGALIAIKIAEEEKQKMEQGESGTTETIQRNRELIKKTRESVATLETNFGQNGQTLVDCLSNLKSFNQSLYGGATAYSPMISILKGNVLN